jgi:hypothetical protein
MRHLVAALRVVTILIGLAILSPATARAAAISPFLTVCANSENCVSLDDLLRNPEGGPVTTFDTTWTWEGVAELEITGAYDADPFISFGVTTTNLSGAPITFAFLFGTPVVPDFYNHATSTGGLSLTNGSSGTTTVDNSAVYASYISGYGTLGLVPTNLGVDLGTTACVSSGTPFTTTATCNQGSTAASFAPTFYNNLEALLTYTQDDLGSVASWSGAVTLTKETTRTPEPATLLLLTPAALGLLASARRRARRR